MKRALLLLSVCLSVAASQPVGCVESSQCHKGYCDKATGACKKCLLCKDFNRSPPSTPVACITAVSQCGACFEGLVEPPSGDVREPCAAGGGGAPAYVWLAAGGLLLFAALIATVYYVLRKKHSLNIFTSTSTAVLAPRADAPPSAPEAPPPYTTTLYCPVRTDSPALPAQHEESERPFLKHAPAAAPAREAAGSQAANMYNNPHYVRGPHLPTKGWDRPEPEPEPEGLADEDTVESPWTPADGANNSLDETPEPERGGEDGAGAGAGGGAGGVAGGGGGAGALSAALAAARGAVLLRPPAGAAPPAKLPRLRQDTNNNGSGRDRSGEEAGGAPSINILVNVQQINDVKL